MIGRKKMEMRQKGKSMPLTKSTRNPGKRMTPNLMLRLLHIR